MKAFAGTRRMFAARGQNVPPLDAAAIRKLASQVRGNVITPETCNLGNQSDVCVRRGCRVRVHWHGATKTPYCKKQKDVTRSS